MKVRPIAKSEVERFARMPDSDNPDWFKATIEQFWRNGMSRSSWCYVAERDDGELAGRVAYWAEDGEPDHRYLLGLHLPWDGDYLAVGCKLISNTLALQRTEGAVEAIYYFYEQYDSHPAERQELMEALGFDLRQAKWRYEWNDTGKPVQVPARLSFRTCAEAGTQALRSLLVRTSEGTLDTDDVYQIETGGVETYADCMMAEFEGLDNRPGMWQLAFGPDGAEVGFVVPQKCDDNEGTINQIAVLPALRGNGYVDDLLARGTAVLQAEGLKSVVAETDQENAPMLAALERAGYVQTGAIWTFVKDLRRAT